MRIVSKGFLVLVSLLLNNSRAQTALYPSNGTLFDGKLHTVNIIFPQENFTALEHPDSLWNNRRYPITFVYDGTDTVKQATIRLKGNTSRGSAKKSYRIDFDRIIDNQTYQGLETIYLHGNHNDASMIREYLSAYTMQQMGISCARVNHVKLYINGNYLGLRGLVEYIDKDFLKTRFGSNKGNNYKCTWPADLAWLGSQEQAYKDVINPSPERERAYDLKTNEDLDDYSRLVTLIDLINNRKNDPDFSQKLEAIFNVDAYLKALAAEVLIGHWDNYYYNKNNYFLYDHPTTKKFVYIPYDMDNTFGVQWGVSDINNRNIHLWGNSNVKAPLTESILAKTEYQKRYEYFLYQAVTDFYNENTMFPIIDTLYEKISSAIASDPQFTGANPSTYGYTVNDWSKSFSQGLGDHNTYGVKPFISDRSTSIYKQMKFNHQVASIDYNSYRIVPNPSNHYIEISGIKAPTRIVLRNTLGVIVKQFLANPKELIDISQLAEGIYYVSFENSNNTYKWIKHP